MNTPPASSLTSSTPTTSQPARISAWRRLGGGSLLLSLSLHTLVILIAGSLYILHVEPERPTGFLPNAGTIRGHEASRRLEHQVKSKAQNHLAKQQRVAVDHPTDQTLRLPGDLPASADIGSASVLERLIHSRGSHGGSLSTGPSSHGPTKFGIAFPPSMVARCGSEDRKKKLIENGGDMRCEAAVSRSLERLSTLQTPDGSWGKTHPAAMTGLALLCYLGRCETPDSPFYGDHVTKGILYLTELSSKNSSGMLSPEPHENAATYEHGIATYALGEMYALSRLGTTSLPGVREAFEHAVKLIIASQLPDGGWGYGDGTETAYRSTGLSDLSVTGWQFQALKAARNTGLKIPGLTSSIQRTVEYLKKRQTKDGGFGTPQRDDVYNQWNLTGCGLLGLQTLAHGETTAMNKAVRFLDRITHDEPLDWTKNANLYTWYYQTQAYFQVGGNAWLRFNQQLLPQLLDHQNNDGSWQQERATTHAASSRAAGADADLYRQTLSTLMLEVYYRYLRVSDRQEP